MSHLRDPTSIQSISPKPSRTALRTSASRSRSRSRSRSPSAPKPSSGSTSHCGVAGSGINPRASLNKQPASSLYASTSANNMSASAVPAPASRVNGHANADGEARRRLGASTVGSGAGAVSSASSTRSTKSPSPAPSSSSAPRSPGRYDYEYDGLPTLAPIRDDDDDDDGEAGQNGPSMNGRRAVYDPDSAFLESPKSEHASLPSSPRATTRSSTLNGLSKPPPPAPSSALGTEGRPLPPIARKRRTSSITRKPSPGAVPKTVVDWEIPRKTLHSSIGFLTLFLWHLDPPSVRPLVTVLSTLLVGCTTADYLRFTFPTFREYWELYFGFLMRESERDKVNGVVWYLVGVIWVLVLYPRDIAVVAILTLSWSDTTASTIGRLWGRHTPPLPPHLPFVKAIKFAPRKSLAGFMAATVTGACICLGFWHNGSNGKWAVLERSVGFALTAVVVGAGGAVVEAMDLGLDDNLTLPILSGALIWVWLSVTNLLF